MLHFFRFCPFTYNSLILLLLLLLLLMGNSKSSMETLPRDFARMNTANDNKNARSHTKNDSREEEEEEESEEEDFVRSGFNERKTSTIEWNKKTKTKEVRTSDDDEDGNRNRRTTTKVLLSSNDRDLDDDETRDRTNVKENNFEVDCDSAERRRKKRDLERERGEQQQSSKPGVGLENFGNTCYCNSVLQALYHCEPFKRRLLEYYATQTDSDSNLLLSLGALFTEMSERERKASMNKKSSRIPVVEPKKFISRLKKSNGVFDSYEHQDAHEFLNYLLNECCEILEKERDEVKDNYDSERNSRNSDQSTQSNIGIGANNNSNNNSNNTNNNKATTSSKSGGISDALMRKITINNDGGKEKQTWVHEVFQGESVNETRCLWCENVTSRAESFIDVSVEVKANSSIQQCLIDYSASELLGGEDKFQCDACSGLHEAHKRLLIRTAPNVLALHLKRFKYIESVDRMQKLNHRVAFSRELKLPNLSQDSTSTDDLYSLFAVVVHIGSGPNHGHYVCFARTSSYKPSGGASERWVMFDDDSVQDMSIDDLETVFGSYENVNSTNDFADNAYDTYRSNNDNYSQGSSEHGYVLFYQKIERDVFTGEDDDDQEELA
jgi:ubiquitin carboxyl-terminal hydrolase 12/46